MREVTTVNISESPVCCAVVLKVLELFLFSASQFIYTLLQWGVLLSLEAGWTSTHSSSTMFCTFQVHCFAIVTSQFVVGSLNQIDPLPAPRSYPLTFWMTGGWKSPEYSGTTCRGTFFFLVMYDRWVVNKTEEKKSNNSYHQDADITLSLSSFFFLIYSL